MIAFGGSEMNVGERSFCAFAGRRDGKPFAFTDDELKEKYAANLRMVERIPDALAGAMGNQMFVATFPTKREMDKFYADAIAESEE